MLSLNGRHYWNDHQRHLWSDRYNQNYNLDARYNINSNWDQSYSPYWHNSHQHRYYNWLPNQHGTLRFNRTPSAPAPSKGILMGNYT